MNSSTATEVTEYWASMVATFLEEFKKAYAGGPRKDRAVASAKLGQVGLIMAEYFATEATRVSKVAGVMDPDSCMAAAQAVKKVTDFHSKKIDKVGRVDNLAVETSGRKQDPQDVN